LDDWPSFSTLVERLAGAFAGSDSSLHVLAVDDGSASAPSAGSICLPRGGPVAEVSVLRLAVNLGHQRAIAAGLSRIAKRDDIDAIVVMDSDGEDRPEDVMRLCAANESHPDAVTFAGRASRTESHAFRAGYRSYKVLFRLLTGRAINFGNFSLLAWCSCRSCGTTCRQPSFARGSPMRQFRPGAEPGMRVHPR
jgi:hypothetical protein